ncbi:unnamed protein product, partial [Oikopleura dioica]
EMSFQLFLGMPV